MAHRTLRRCTHHWRISAISLLAAATIAAQIAVLTHVPEQMQQVADWTLSLLCFAAIVFIAKFRLPRTTTVHRVDRQENAAPLPTVEADREPSERMRAAWLTARAGSDIDLVSQLADVPYSFAELIVADARSHGPELHREHKS